MIVTAILARNEADRLCPTCGKTFGRPANRSPSAWTKQRYCSLGCVGRQRESNYNWKGGRRLRDDGYVSLAFVGHPRANSEGRVLEHILVAEKAIGKSLPLGAEIHHVNEMKSDNRPSNLVVCQDRAYHFLLHVRMRAKAGCGNPNFRKCTMCGKWDSQGALDTRGHYPVFYHAECRRARDRGNWPQRKARRQCLS